jgi:hypothetical protein
VIKHKANENFIDVLRQDSPIVDHVEFIWRIMYSIINYFNGILAGIPNGDGGGRNLLDSCAIMG